MVIRKYYVIYLYIEHKIGHYQWWCLTPEIKYIWPAKGLELLQIFSRRMNC